MLLQKIILTIGLFFLSILSRAQSALYNLGTTHTLYIGSNFTVHCESDVTNAAGATLEFDGASASLLQLKGHFTNSVTGVLTCGVGTISFVGAANQDADFGGDNLYNLKISNTSGDVDLTRAATVTNNLNFTTGDLNTTDANILSLTSSATATGAADGNHVNGPINKSTAATTQFTFPVGNGSKYRPHAITPSSAAATTWKGRYFFTPYTDLTNNDLTIVHVSSIEYWELERTAGTANGVVTLSWDAVSGVTALASLNTAYYTGANWTKSGGNNRTGTVAAGTIDSDTWTTWTFDIFTLATTAWIDNGLPVELLDFSAIKENEKVAVKWSTASEINSDYYDIKRSKDGLTFESIGTYPAAGNSNSILHYAMYDENPLEGTSYYQLTEYDKDGKSQKSSISTLYFDKAFNVLTQLFPNPSSDKTTLSFNSELGGMYYLNISDAVGNSVYTAMIAASEGANKFNLSLSHLNNGVYFFALSDARKKVNTLQFVKND